MTQKYPNLCKPITLGRVTFRNRMFSAPMGATDITADSYTANWTAPEGEVIDYFMVTRTKYLRNGSTEVEYLPPKAPRWKS